MHITIAPLIFGHFFCYFVSDSNILNQHSLFFTQDLMSQPNPNPKKKTTPKVKSKAEKKSTEPYSLWIMGIGLFCAISVLMTVEHLMEQPWLMLASGSTGLLLFAYPSSPFSQSKNVLGGHVLATVIGLACLHFLGDSWWSLALSCSVSSMLMIRLNIIHPPAVSNPLVIFAAGSTWSFLLFPMIFGLILLIICAKFYWYLHRRLI